MHCSVTGSHATGKSPADLLLGRKLQLHPDFQSQVHAKQLKQKEQHDQHARASSLQEGAPVYTKNFSARRNWIPGTVEKMTDGQRQAGQTSCGPSTAFHSLHLRTECSDLLTESLQVQSPRPVSALDPIEPSPDPAEGAYVQPQEGLPQPMSSTVLSASQ